MKVLFVGDRPSSRNKSIDVPFVGTASYKRLKDWERYLIVASDIEVSYSNSHTLKDLENILKFEGKIVSLGLNAKLRLDVLGVQHHTLPHPSPLNFSLNNKSYVYKKLNACKRWLYTEIEKAI